MQRTRDRSDHDPSVMPHLRDLATRSAPGVDFVILYHRLSSREN